MNKIVAVHQPNFMPWLGFWDKVMKSDLMILLDNVQFSRGSFTNRCKIKTNQGESWLTVPIRQKYGQLIRDVRIINGINGDKWIRKHIGTIYHNYRKCPFFMNYFPSLVRIYQKNKVFLVDFNKKFIALFSDWMDLNCEFVFASELGISIKGIDDPTSKLIELVKFVGGTHYLSGISGTKYLKKEQFQENNIYLEYQIFEHPKYFQFGEFIPNLSVLDILMNQGGKLTKEILR